ncbi:unnamed protein product [Paramecium octaurelia]|uniref:Phosphatidic acid phosphatase type 2/haloperoxidase domain-containing protein n=1 Tax=Paramecium octaurelia TaxID=43137 RepID=A0A8S1X151_PAROT|nr:unnamed protein product [Paramecium octaurelia]
MLDIEFNDQMWEANTALTEYLQEHQFPGEKEVFLFFSHSLYALPAIALIAYLFFDNKMGALLYVCLIQTIFAENQILKNIYRQARPYFIESAIQPYECNKEFGKPSGHAMSSSAMCFLVPLIIFPAILSDKLNHKYLRVIVIAIVTIWTFMTGFSRVFMGVHSFGQILLGWVYSAYSILIYMRYFHNPITHYIKQCLQPGSQGVPGNVVQAVGLFALVWTGLSILLFEFNNKVLREEDEVDDWLDALYQKCADQKTHYKFNSPQVLHNISFSLSLYIWLPFSFILGVKLSKGIYNENQFSVYYKLLTFWQKVSRVLIFLFLISTLIPLVLSQFESSYGYAFGKILPFSILLGLYVTYIYSKILNYFKLTVEGDFIQMSSQLVSAPEGYKASELGQINF